MPMIIGRFFCVLVMDPYGEFVSMIMLLDNPAVFCIVGHDFKIGFGLTEYGKIRIRQNKCFL